MDPPYDLVALQSVDLEIDRLERRKATLPELEEFRRLRERRLGVDAEHSQVSEEARSLDLEFDRVNGELQIMETRLEVAEKRLYGGGMSAKETENRRMEVESLRMRIGEQEAVALDLMESREEVTSRLSELSADVEEVTASEDSLGAVVRGIWEEIDAELTKRRAERDLAVAPVPPRVLEIYENLRKDKGGVAAGRLEESTCGGCHLALSESERQEAAETDPARCPHCRRILVF
ncbi:MAG: hypothetical protein F4Z41_06865 [Acidimicrobiia bacterium]|nr:hypothetical protein [Acidimicrobiia bacterium]